METITHHGGQPGHYDPVQGTGWDHEEAMLLWFQSVDRVNRQGPKWSIRGARPSEFWWSYFSFQPFTGKVTIEPDGFRWQTADYHTGEVIHSGVTTSLYAAYQSVVQNKPVDPPACTCLP